MTKEEEEKLKDRLGNFLYELSALLERHKVHLTVRDRYADLARYFYVKFPEHPLFSDGFKLEFLAGLYPGDINAYIKKNYGNSKEEYYAYL